MSVEDYTKTDPTVDAYIAEINESYAQLGNRKIGESKVEFITHDKDGNRLVRISETNLGDFCSDALYVMTGADIAFVNGGGLRAPLASGDITFNDIFSVFPFNNQIMTAEVSGQIFLDFLELAMMSYPEEDGTFPHVSGITFSVNKSIPSSVKLDENGFFEKVDGAYRVYDVKVLDKASGEYKALDLNSKYVLASINYYLVEFGGGATMFKDAKLLDAEGILDVELIENYIVEHLGGVIGEEYAGVKPNIHFTDGVITETPDDKEQDDKEPFSPQTGDNSHIVVWGLLAVLSLSALVTLGTYRRKEMQ